MSSITFRNCRGGLVFTLALGASFAAGCGTGEYNRRYEDRLKNLQTGVAAAPSSPATPPGAAAPSVPTPGDVGGGTSPGVPSGGGIPGVPGSGVPGVPGSGVPGVPGSAGSGVPGVGPGTGTP